MLPHQLSYLGMSHTTKHIGADASHCYIYAEICFGGTSNCSANSASVLSLLIVAHATLALSLAA
jgi:hypothetical protein